MKIGIMSGGHLQHYGGGAKEVIWHSLACRDLGHDVTILTTHGVHPRLMPKLHGFPIKMYWRGSEAQYQVAITIDHFNAPQVPAQEKSFYRVMFPAIQANIPDWLHVYTNSNFTAAHVKDRWNVDAQTLYLPIEDYYHVGYKEPAILHVSRFAEANEWADKGHPQMIQAMRALQYKLPGWRLILAGAVERGQDGYVDALLELAKGLPVEFMFDPTDEEMIGLYAKSSILWHCTGMGLPMIPSAQEHFGITPLEAQASGCVPVVYRSGGMPEVVKPNQTGLLFDDVRQLGQLTVDLANQLHNWAAFQQYGLMWAKSWMDFDAFKGRVQEMLDGKPISPLPNYLPTFAYHAQDVTAVIPSMNNFDVLKRCLESLKKTVPTMQVLVINNGDPLPFQIDGVRVHDVGYNAGFAGAHRIAESLVTTDLVLLLNDDTESFNMNWLGLAILPFSDNDVGVVAPKLIFPDGRLQYAGGVVDWNREDIGYHRFYGQSDNFEANQTYETDYATGAALLCKRELYHIEDYLLEGLNMEDVDICFRAKQKGFKVIYQPASCLIHYEGITKAKVESSTSKVNSNRAKFREIWRP